MEAQAENMSDIQNYLDTFQKEIQTNQHDAGTCPIVCYDLHWLEVGF